ncbi:MAG: tetratricopeptide repeat protein, partial [Fimbriimonadales bacterium]|nr:tetratricopeptide repeat protein [Fimbriimonadales bacterium]
KQEVPIFAQGYADALKPAFEALQQDRSGDAYEAFLQYLAQHPDDENAYEGAIVALLQQTRWDEAEQLTHQARAACPNSVILAARQAWNWIYLTRESEAYPLTVQLLERGYTHPDWLREVVLPLRNVLICHASDPRLVSSKKHKRRDDRATLLKGIQTLEHWLERYQFPIPDEPVGVKITLSMIARNEAQYLEECLKSVQGVVDEIVLVDTGSDDDTPKIAERYGAKVIHAEWQNDFAAARNIALQHATGDWILVLDADERLTPESKQAILNAARCPQFAGYYLEILNEIRNGDYFVHRIVRMFRRLPHLRWQGAIHEQITPSIVERKGRIATVSAQIRHLGYRGEVVKSRDKIQRNIELIQRELERDPDDLFHKFNLANTYFSAGDYEQAVYWAEQACPYLRGDEDYAGQSWSIWIESLLNLQRCEEALQVGADALARGVDSPIVHYTLANVYYQLGCHQKSLESLEAARESAMRIGLLAPDGETLLAGSGYVGDVGVATYKWRFAYARALRALGRHTEASAFYQRLLRERPNDPVVLLDYGQLLLEQGERAAAEHVFLQLSSHEAYHFLAQQFLAKLWWECGDYARALPYVRTVALAMPNDHAWQERWQHAAQESGDWRSLAEAYTHYEAHGYPINAEMYINWGRALWQLKDYENALRCFAAAIDLNPQDANAFLNAGDALYQLGAYSEAADAYSAGIERDPYNAQAWFTLGNCYFRLGVYDAAKIAYEQALSIDPKHRQSQHNLELTRERIRITAA